MISPVTAHERLGAGERAPDFQAQTMDGTTVRLSDYRGKPLWLAFFRYARCPLCNFRIHELVSQWAQTFAERDFTMVGVFQSPPDGLKGLMERHDPPFTVVPDPELKLYTDYRLETSMSGAMGADVRHALAGARKAKIPILHTWDGPVTRVPADFLIDGDGIIQQAFYGENIAQHIPFEDVTRFLDARGHRGS